ncbi:MAG TPA: peptidylprolyl isomerase [Puia sp.]|nr:peptidylprolyl isomerase [Puia sp.]
MNQLVRKLILIPILSLSLFTGLTAQTLFTCGGMNVSKEDFLKAYNKNNTGEKATEKSYRDYLELYIRYKLKVKAAYEMQLDTLPGQRTELQSFRSQVADNYLKDEESLDKMVNEAFTRGQRDIHLAHIFIPLPKNAAPYDTARAYEKAMGAYNALKSGQSFGKTALLYSSDPSARDNAGDIGYITVFTLPYELESLAYSTPPGKFSKPYRSKAGYHIFRNVGERKSLGRIKVAQILLSFPPGATEAARNATRLRADSVYDLLVKGADFAAKAQTLSGDNLSFQNGGEIPEFGVGKYDSAFEAAAFALGQDGAISRPVASLFGYHIIKRIARKPFPAQFNKETAAYIRQQITADPRIELARRALLKKVLQQVGWRSGTFSEDDLWAFTDSVMLNTGLSSFRSLSYSSVLFSFSSQQYTAKGWLDYARTAKAPRTGSGGRTDKELFDSYLERVALEYYRNHLEEYNRDFAFQLTEFKEGNLLFEIMQRKIWDKASTDSAGLRNYYEAHKNKYWWDSSADALLFTCNNEKTAQAMRSNLGGNVNDWRKWTDSVGAAVQADSGRYELAQIPTEGKRSFQPGTFTPIITNKSDNTVSFAYILNVYNERSPRNYKDARGFVINDYQAYLEDQWIAELKKKYPVNVEEKVVASLPK